MGICLFFLSWEANRNLEKKGSERKVDIRNLGIKTKSFYQNRNKKKMKLWFLLFNRKFQVEFSTNQIIEKEEKEEKEK